MVGALYTLCCVATLAASPPLVTVKLDIDNSLQTAMPLLPSFDGLRTVGSDEVADVTVHARMTRDPGGPTVTMWLTTPTAIDSPPKRLPVKVACDVDPDCRTAEAGDRAVRAVFTHALDLTLFSYRHGLGHLNITYCHSLLAIELEVNSPKRVGLDHFLFYILANYGKDGSVASTMQRELRLLPDGRHSDTRGRFYAVGGSARDTEEYFQRSCKNGKVPPFALVMQLRSPDLRWKTAAPSLPTLH